MKKAKQITALVAVILLVALYIITFIAAFFTDAESSTLFTTCMILTIVIPLFAFILILFFGRASGKKIIGDPEPIEIPDEIIENDSKVATSETVAEDSTN